MAVCILCQLLGEVPIWENVQKALENANCHNLKKMLKFEKFYSNPEITFQVFHHFLYTFYKALLCDHVYSLIPWPTGQGIRSILKFLLVCEFKSQTLQLIFQVVLDLYGRGFEPYSPSFVLLPPSMGLQCILHGNLVVLTTFFIFRLLVATDF